MFRRHLYTQRFYTEKEVFTYRCFVQRCFCAPKQRHIGIFPHRTFATEKPLHRTIFTHRFFGTEKNRHRESCTHRLHKKYTPKLLHAETLPRTVFTQQALFRTEAFPDRFFEWTTFFYRQMVSTQKVLRTEVLRTEGFTHNILYIQTFFYTDVFTRKTNCTQKLVHTEHFYTQPAFIHREVLFPLLDHLPFVFPLSSIIIPHHMDSTYVSNVYI